VPTFAAHVQQAAANLRFLAHINATAPDHRDWAVTVSFYTALHLVNAHLSQQQLQYRTHTDVKQALNPTRLSPARLPEDEYVAYAALQMLSRRSRYLVNERDLHQTQPALTFDQHLARALRHLDRLLAYFAGRYGLTELPLITVACPGLHPADNLRFLRLRAQ
jgi:hypothetical protein